MCFKFCFGWKKTQPGSTPETEEPAITAMPSDLPPQVKQPPQIPIPIMSGKDLYKYVTYKPKGGDARVKAAWEKIYSIPGIHGHGLSAAVDTYLVDTTWDVKTSWKNDTDAEQRYDVEYETDFRITQGEEINNGYPIASVYQGMTVTVEGQNKVLETTNKKTTVHVTVSARSQLIFYQRRYRFKSSTFFVLQAWSQYWNVVSSGGELLRKECMVEVFSEDYATLQTALDGSTMGTIDVATVEAVGGAPQTRKREDCPEMCKNKLAEMGV